jgi:protein-tyrosine phosphatase
MSWPSERSRDGGIDLIPLPRSFGRLWICGKHAVGPDPEAALSRAGATTMVCLNERHELEDRYPAYVEWLTSGNRRRVVWFPIHDLHAPPLYDAIPFLDDLVLRLDHGERLLMHCGAGIGRAGTMAACLLVRLGAGAPDALDVVAAHRPMAGPEMGVQRDLVDAVAAATRQV